MWRLVMCCSHFRLIWSGATLLYHVVLGCADSLRHRKHVTSLSTRSLSASDAGSLVSGLSGMLVSPVRSGGGQQPVVPGPLRVTNTPPAQTRTAASNWTNDAEDETVFITLCKNVQRNLITGNVSLHISCPRHHTTLTWCQLLNLGLSSNFNINFKIQIFLTAFTTRSGYVTSHSVLVTCNYPFSLLATLIVNYNSCKANSHSLEPIELLASVS